nr:hypothetical protein GZ9D8_32 [uncultured archaeon GZfos9D8]
MDISIFKYVFVFINNPCNCSESCGFRAITLFRVCGDVGRAHENHTNYVLISLARFAERTCAKTFLHAKTFTKKCLRYFCFAKTLVSLVKLSF